MMGAKARPTIIDLSKGEVGEIDTRAPFQSVKAAVSLFGEVKFSSDKSAARKTKAPSERALAKETELHLAQKELNKYKEQFHNAETTRTQALAELERAKRIVEELTNKLNAINKSKEVALQAAEVAKSQTKQLEDATSDVSNVEDGTWKKELDSAKELYAAAFTELDSAKTELRRIKKDFETSMEAKHKAVEQEVEAKQLFNVNTEKAAELAKEIGAAKESILHVKLATEQAQQEESKIRTDKNAAKESYKQSLEETGKKLAALKKEFDPEYYKNLEAKLAETNAEIAAVQKKLEDARASDIQSLAALTADLEGAKEVLQKVSEEENSLRSLVESLKLELEGARKKHSELKEKDAETESVVSHLHIKLQKCKAELEAAMAAESKAASASDDLMLALEQLSSESQCALQEAEAMKASAAQLRSEAEETRVILDEAEKKLQVALKDADEAKAAEARALDQIKDLSEKANAARSSTSESGAKITISKDEYESLCRKVEESEKLTEMKVAAAKAQADAVKASENEAITRLEAVKKEMEDLEAATEDELKRAEMAEAAKKAVEGELKRWREMEQQKAAVTASGTLAETQMSVEALPPKPNTIIVEKPLTGKPLTAEKPLTGKPLTIEKPITGKPHRVEKSHENHKSSKHSSTKKPLLTNISGMFHRKHSRQDSGGSQSYLPGEKPI